MSATTRIRQAEDGDRLPLALLFAAVAGERDGIAAEPPVDVEKRAASRDVERTLVAADRRGRRWWRPRSTGRAYASAST